MVRPELTLITGGRRMSAQQNAALLRRFFEGMQLLSWPGMNNDGEHLGGMGRESLSTWQGFAWIGARGRR